MSTPKSALQLQLETAAAEAIAQTLATRKLPADASLADIEASARAAGQAIEQMIAAALAAESAAQPSATPPACPTCKKK